MSVWSLKNKRNLNFVIFINKKCLKSISSVKTKKITKPFQRENIIFFMLFFEYINRSWVNPINERQQETHGLLGKNKTKRILWNKSITGEYGGNECIPKISITWIRLNYLTCVALFFSLFFWIADLHDKNFWIITEFHREKDRLADILLCFSKEVIQRRI